MILIHATFQAMLPLKVKYAERERKSLGSYLVYEIFEHVDCQGFVATWNAFEAI